MSTASLLVVIVLLLVKTDDAIFFAILLAKDSELYCALRVCAEHYKCTVFHVQ